MRSIYKPIPNWPNYFVTKDGDVYSDRPWTHANTKGGWRKLKPHPDKRGGYLIVRLRKGGSGYTRTVHRLVLETFIGPRPRDMECIHKDGNPANAALSNLRWGTHIENEADKRRHGTLKKGEAHWHNKLTRQQVVEIRRLAKAGVLHKKIAPLFGIHKSVVSGIVTGARWGWLREAA
jgi:hypothetical protein